MKVQALFLLIAVASCTVGEPLALSGDDNFIGNGDGMIIAESDAKTSSINSNSHENKKNITELDDEIDELLKQNEEIKFQDTQRIDNLGLNNEVEDEDNNSLDSVSNENLTDENEDYNEYDNESEVQDISVSRRLLASRRRVTRTAAKRRAAKAAAKRKAAKAAAKRRAAKLAAKRRAAKAAAKRKAAKLAAKRKGS